MGKEERRIQTRIVEEIRGKDRRGGGGRGKGRRLGGGGEEDVDEDGRGEEGRRQAVQG